MKLVSALLLIAAFGYGQASLQDSFDKGVQNAPDLHLGTLLEPATQELKQSLILAFSKFIQQVDSVLSQNATTAIRATDQRLKNFNNLLEHQLPEVTAGTATSTTFDQFLGYMQEIYDVYSEVTQAKRSTFRGQQVTRSSWPFMDWIFVDLDKNVKLYLDQLQQWSAQVLSAGVSQDVKDLPDIQEAINSQYLYPELKVIQKYAESLQKYEDVFQKYSSASVWKGYKASRDEVVKINV